MKSDVFVVSIEIKKGFEEIVKDVCQMQASREEPRKLVSTSILDNFLFLFFELV